MKRSNLSRCAISFATVFAILTGCGGGQPPYASTGYADARTWMLPEAKAQDLLYASTPQQVDVFSYPGGSLVGNLQPGETIEGVCSDASGDVFVNTDANAGSGHIYEYAHGDSTPNRILTAEGGAPGECSSDSTTGDLAATILTFSGPGFLLIYRHAKGKPQRYQDSKFYTYESCAYDRNGNLFIDDGTNLLAELRTGSSHFSNHPLALKASGNWLGRLQWDGSHIVAQEMPDGAGHALIDRIHIAHSKASIVGRSRLKGTHVVLASIYSDTLIGFEKQGSKEVALWHYPTGGKAFETFSGNTKHYNGAAVSPATP